MKILRFFKKLLLAFIIVIITLFIMRGIPFVVVFICNNYWLILHTLNCNSL